MQSEGKRTDSATPGGDTVSEPQIAKALEQVRSRLEQQEVERAAIDRAMAASKEEERLLQRLLDLRRGALPRTGGNTAGPRPEVTTQRGHPAVLAVIEELANTGRPVHISDLMRILSERHIAIPGAGSQANLIAHLRRDPRLVRPSRGMYGLADWGLENMTPGQRKLRKKRLRVTAHTSGAHS